MWIGAIYYFKVPTKKEFSRKAFYTHFSWPKMYSVQMTTGNKPIVTPKMYTNTLQYLEYYKYSALQSMVTFQVWCIGNSN